MKIEKIMVREQRARYIPRYKYKDYVGWEGKWELIDGHPYAMAPSPVPKHQLVSSRIDTQLNNKLKDCPKCAALSPVDWVIDERNVVQPDNMVICYKPKGKNLTRAPAIIFELLSPLTEVIDREVKFHIYLSQKVKYYIIVDIEKERAEVYKLSGKKYRRITSKHSETVSVDTGKCKFGFDFGEIWG